MLRVFSAQAVYLAAPVVIILRLGLDEGIELIHYLPTSHYYYANRADRRAIVVGRLEIYGCKVLHIYCVFFIGMCVFAQSKDYIFSIIAGRS